MRCSCAACAWAWAPTRCTPPPAASCRRSPASRSRRRLAPDNHQRLEAPVEPLVTLEELEAKLGQTLDDEEKRDAEGALEEASMLVRHYGAPWPDPAKAPQVAKTLVIRSVKRYLKNPEGYTQSRAGDESVAWDGLGDRAMAPYLTKAERQMAASAAGRGGVTSAPIQPWGELRECQDIIVPSTDGRPFPFIGGGCC